MTVPEVPWQPPAWCLIWLTGLVTLLSIAALAMSTFLVSTSLSSTGPQLAAAATLWLFYLAVTVTCFKALADWIKRPE